MSIRKAPGDTRRFLKTCTAINASSQFIQNPEMASASVSGALYFFFFLL